MNDLYFYPKCSSDHSDKPDLVWQFAPESTPANALDQQYIEFAMLFDGWIVPLKTAVAAVMGFEPGKPATREEMLAGFFQPFQKILLNRTSVIVITQIAVSDFRQ